MPISSVSHQSVPVGPPPPPIRWLSWPLRDEPVRAALTLVGLAIATAIMRVAGVPTHLMVLALMTLILALWRFFIPVRIEFNPEGIHQTVFGWRRRIPWAAIRRFEVDAAGVLFLPHADHRPMDSLRGLYLPWGGHREEVLAQVRYYLGGPPVA